MFCCGFFTWPRAEGHGSAGPDRARPAPARTNAAFEEYRVETLRRLEQEQGDFHGFLDRLRVARDRAAFDQFMAERRARPDASALQA